MDRLLPTSPWHEWAFFCPFFLLKPLLWLGWSADTEFNTLAVCAGGGEICLCLSLRFTFPWLNFPSLSIFYETNDNCALLGAPVEPGLELGQCHLWVFAACESCWDGLVALQMGRKCWRECRLSHFSVLSGRKQIMPQGFVVILFFWKRYSGERLHLLNPPPSLSQLRTPGLWGDNKSVRVGFNINLESWCGFFSNRKLLPVLKDADACRAQKTGSCLV